MTGSPGSDKFGSTKGSEDQQLRIGGWVTRQSKSKSAPPAQATAAKPPKAVGRVVVTGLPSPSTSTAGGDQPVEVDHPAEPATPDPFPDELSDAPRPRWWKHPAVARAGIASGVLATVALTFLVLPGSPEPPGGTWRPPALLPTVDSGVSVIISATPPAPGQSSPAVTAAPATPSRAVVTRRPATPTAAASNTPRTTPSVNSPSARPSASRTQSSAPKTGELAPLPPSRERELRSIKNDQPTAIEFVNNRREPVLVYWLDHHGRRVPYRLLMPKSSYRQPTYVTHPWVVTRMDGRALAIFLPDRTPARAVIT